MSVLRPAVPTITVTTPGTKLYRYMAVMKCAYVATTTRDEEDKNLR